MVCHVMHVVCTSVLLFCFAAAKPRLSGSFAHGDSRICYHRCSCNTSPHFCMQTAMIPNTTVSVRVGAHLSAYARAGLRNELTLMAYKTCAR